jgi:phosphoribosylglycinamide formyltransferase-1
MKRIVFLISGRGSNMAAVVQACAREAWPAVCVGVISNRPDAPGLGRARGLGLSTQVIDHSAHVDRAAFDAALGDAVDTLAPDWVVLAGFMRILGDRFVQRFAGRLVNIHPSLLPAFPGLHTHRRALEAGCKLAGATVHFVTPELDHGPIIAQAMVPVRSDDDAASLAARVLEAEHRLYPLALRWCVEGSLVVAQGVVRHARGEPQLVLHD